MTDRGREIAVDGVRPVWLADDVVVEFRCKDGYVDRTSAGVFSDAVDWWAPSAGRDQIVAIRLPADHFAYTALDAGFTPWAGGESAPEDWDGGEVLLRGGQLGVGEVWSRGTAISAAEIIGYHAHPTPTTADPALATYDPRTHTAVPLMTEAEAWDNLRSDGIDTETGLAVGYIRALKWAGIIRPETLADRFTRETGIAVTADVAKALEFGR